MYNRTFRDRGQQSKFVHPEDLLEDGLYELGLDEQLAGDDRLMEYITELMNWNRIYNLTSVRKPTEIVTRHILDSLTVLPYLHGRRILDIGTGAGLPGIPPPGPAIPVMLIPTSVPSLSRTPRAICMAISSLTAPYLTSAS